MHELSSKARLEHHQSPDLDLIVAPWGFGGTDNLAQEGAFSFLENDLVKRLEAIGSTVNLIEEEGLGPFQISEEPNRIRNIEALCDINNWLAARVKKSAKNGSIPITIGGDASLSIATVAGMKNAGKDVGILWLNNHLANSSPKVTKTWNANRMAFTMLTKSDVEHQDFQDLISISEEKPIIEKQKVVQLGVSHKSANPAVDHEYYTMEDIEETGIQEITKEIIDKLLKVSDQVHVIWDLNSLDIRGVSNFSLGQLNYREAIMIARIIDLKLRRHNKLASLDIVEHCPSREAWDKKGEGAVWATDIISNIFGENIYNCLRKY